MPPGGFASKIIKDHFAWPLFSISPHKLNLTTAYSRITFTESYNISTFNTEPHMGILGSGYAEQLAGKRDQLLPGQVMPPCWGPVPDAAARLVEPGS